MNVRINKDSDVPAYRQLAEQIAFRIAAGELKLGDPLPSVREMALVGRSHR
jgi:GntR family transcriptional regulator